MGLRIHHGALNPCGHNVATISGSPQFCSLCPLALKRTNSEASAKTDIQRQKWTYPESYLHGRVELSLLVKFVTEGFELYAPWVFILTFRVALVGPRSKLTTLLLYLQLILIGGGLPRLGNLSACRYVGNVMTTGDTTLEKETKAFLPLHSTPMSSVFPPPSDILKVLKVILEVSNELLGLRVTWATTGPFMSTVSRPHPEISDTINNDVENRITLTLF